MKRNLIIVTTLAVLGFSTAGPLLANQSGALANGNGLTEAQMFQAAKISLQQASDIAMKEVAGTLSAIGFNDENGSGIYEATVVNKAGESSIVKIDADTGAVLGKGLASIMDDEGNNEGEGGHESGENGHGEDGND